MPESPWLIPAEEDPSRPVSIHVLNLWLQRAKDRAGIDVKGLGFHAQKRARVRRKEFSQLPPKVQEALTGTNHETRRKVYDDVSLEEMREAMERLEESRQSSVFTSVPRTAGRGRIPDVVPTDDAVDISIDTRRPNTLKTESPAARQLATGLPVYL